MTQQCHLGGRKEMLMMASHLGRGATKMKRWRIVKEVCLCQDIYSLGCTSVFLCTSDMLYKIDTEYHVNVHVRVKYKSD